MRHVSMGIAGVILALLLGRAAGILAQDDVRTPAKPAAGAASADGEAPGNGKILIGWYPEWGIYERQFFVTNLRAADLQKLTHIYYAFAKIDDQGECALFDQWAATDYGYPTDHAADPLRGNIHQLHLLRDKYPHLKLVVSVGGWTLSSAFTDACATAESRTKFTKSCVAFMTQYGFDGLDMDWEYPVEGGLPNNKHRPDDMTNFTAMMVQLRQRLDTQGKTDGKHYLLTFCGPAGPQNFKHFELKKLAAIADWVNMMAYDYNGDWNDITDFEAPMYPQPGNPQRDPMIREKFNVDATLKGYLAAGVPPAKIVMGIPFYGRGWMGVKDVNHGLYQPHAAENPRGSWPKEPAMWDYKDLAKNYVPNMTRYWNDAAESPYLFDPKKGLMIAYDDAESIGYKVDYLMHNKLAGAMVWELSQDDAKGTLLEVVYNGLGQPQRNEPLQRQDSK